MFAKLLWSPVLCAFRVACAKRPFTPLVSTSMVFAISRLVPVATDEGRAVQVRMDYPVAGDLCPMCVPCRSHLLVCDQPCHVPQESQKSAPLTFQRPMSKVMSLRLPCRAAASPAPRHVTSAHPL